MERVAAVEGVEVRQVTVALPGWPTMEQRRRIWLSVLLEASARHLLPPEIVRELLTGPFRLYA
jgi:hypothetical protein